MKLNSKYTYQNNFSQKNDSVLNSNVRTQKSKKIFAVLKNCLGKEIKNLNQMTCLDIGGSAGFTATLMSPYVKKFYVVDIDKNALKFGKRNNGAKNIVYKLGDAMDLGFKDNSIDIVVCNHVYEHVAGARILVNEIRRVLKTGGICYFGAANKFSLFEPHYNLLFLSWLPKKIANIYVKMARGKGYYYENLLSYFSLRKLLTPFEIHDYTLRVIKEPEKFFNIDLVKPNSIVAKIPNLLLKVLEPCIPSYIFVLKKKGGNNI